MKKIIVLFMITIFVFSLASCSKSTNIESTENTEKQDSTIIESEGNTEKQDLNITEPAQSDTEAQASSETLPDGYYNVGDFTVFVPEGWTAIPVPDRDDPSKILTYDIQLAKDAIYNEASNTWNTDDGVSFYVTLLPQEDFERVPEGRDYYAKDFAVTDMEDITIGELTWHGFLVSPIGAPVYMMWAARGNGVGGYYTSISTAYDMSLEDADIQAILGSLK